MKLKINKKFYKRAKEKKIRNQKIRTELKTIVYDKLKLNDKIEKK
jgi:hypothetical protein